MHHLLACHNKVWTSFGLHFAENTWRVHYDNLTTSYGKDNVLSLFHPPTDDPTSLRLFHQQMMFELQLVNEVQQRRNAGSLLINGADGSLMSIHDGMAQILKEYGAIPNNHEV